MANCNELGKVKSVKIGQSAAKLLSPYIEDCLGNFLLYKDMKYAQRSTTNHRVEPQAIGGRNGDHPNSIRVDEVR